MTDIPTPRTVKCPHCGAGVPWLPESRYRPFCSERCRQIDLGAWAAGDYRVPAQDPDPELAVDGTQPTATDEC